MFCCTSASLIVPSVCVLLCATFYWVYKRGKQGTFSLRSCRVIITGAGSGLGRCLALELSKYDVYGVHELVLWDINAQGLNETERLIQVQPSASHHQGRKVHVSTHLVDVTNSVQVTTCIDLIMVSSAKGVTNVLINNAGCVAGCSFVEGKLTPDAFHRTMHVNVGGCFHCTHAILPYMKQHGAGLIVNIASVLGMSYSDCLLDYVASKWAVIGLTGSLRAELMLAGYEDIHTLCVYPYALDTNMFDGIFEGGDRWVRRMFFPRLNTVNVAESIIQAMLRGDTRVYLPSVFYLAPLLQLLPTELHLRLLRWMGGIGVMTNFRGHGQPVQCEIDEKVVGLKSK